MWLRSKAFRSSERFMGLMPSAQKLDMAFYSLLWGLNSMFLFVLRGSNAQCSHSHCSATGQLLLSGT